MLPSMPRLLIVTTRKSYLQTMFNEATTYLGSYMVVAEGLISITKVGGTVHICSRP
jgi:hypothetical protein